MAERKHLRLVGSFAAALALHAIAYFLFLPKKTPRVATKTPVVVERGTPSRATDRGDFGAKRGGGGRRAPRMSDLMLGESDSASEGKSGHGSRKGSGLGQSAYDRLPFEASAPLLPLFAALWARLDSAVDYPQELLDSRIGGTVSLRFTVDGKGALASDITLVHSDSVVLEAYVIAIVAAVLENGFAGPRRAKSDRTPVQLVVDFETTSQLRAQQGDRGNWKGNALTLHRRGYVPPYAEEMLDRIFTRFVPPVFPLPGGFFVDVVRLVQFLQNTGTPDPDELRTVRLEGFRRKFLKLYHPTEPDTF